MYGVLIYRQTRSIIKRDKYPNAFGAPIPGFGLADTGSTYEWLIDQYIDNTPVDYDYDPRYYYLDQIEDLTPGIEHPDYPGVGAIRKISSLSATTVQERLNALESAENNANYGIMPITKQLKHIVIAINALRRYVQGITLESYEETILSKINTYANKIASNYSITKIKENQINGGLEPDLDSDWIDE